MTNFDKLVKEKRELIIDILGRAMCFDESGDALVEARPSCDGCKFFLSDNCFVDVKEWLCKEVDGQDEKHCDSCKFVAIAPLHEPCTSCHEYSNWQECEVKK